MLIYVLSLFRYEVYSGDPVKSEHDESGRKYPTAKTISLVRGLLIGISECCFMEMFQIISLQRSKNISLCNVLMESYSLIRIKFFLFIIIYRVIFTLILDNY